MSVWRPRRGITQSRDPTRRRNYTTRQGRPRGRRARRRRCPGWHRGSPSGDNGSDGVSESQGRHGGRRHGLDLSGTITAVGLSSVTIKTSTTTTTYRGPGHSDVEHNEAALSNPAVGDKITFSVDGGKVIDKLHAGDGTKNLPQRGGSSSSRSDSTSGEQPCRHRRGFSGCATKQHRVAGPSVGSRRSFSGREVGCCQGCCPRSAVGAGRVGAGLLTGQRSDEDSLR